MYNWDPSDCVWLQGSKASCWLVVRMEKSRRLLHCSALRSSSSFSVSDSSRDVRGIRIGGGGNTMETAGFPWEWKLVLQGFHCDGNRCHGTLTGMENILRDSREECCCTWLLQKSKVNRWIYVVLYYKPFLSKALRYGPCVTRGSHSFTCHPHTNHTCLYSPATRPHHPLSGIHSCCISYYYDITLHDR